MIRVVGFGNSLHGDDGFGPFVVKLLSSRLRLSNVTACEGGSPGLAALGLFEGCDTVLIIDAVMDGGPEGEVGWVDPMEVVKTATPGRWHEEGLAEMLRMLPLAVDGKLPNIEILLGRISATQPFCECLSSEVLRGAVRAADVIEARIRALTPEKSVNA
ncbi:MAG: hydrogenase maturation protease [Rhodospirillales bacterium]|nr:hydrogenase maturation protease [Rhodospirillales bacterium]